MSYPPKSGVPPSPPFLLDQIEDPFFPLSGWRTGTSTGQTMVINGSSNIVTGEELSNTAPNIREIVGQEYSLF